MSSRYFAKLFSHPQKCYNEPTDNSPTARKATTCKTETRRPNGISRTYWSRHWTCRRSREDSEMRPFCAENGCPGGNGRTIFFIWERCGTILLKSIRTIDGCRRAVREAGICIWLEAELGSFSIAIEIVFVFLFLFVLVSQFEFGWILVWLQVGLLYHFIRTKYRAFVSRRVLEWLTQLWEAEEWTITHLSLACFGNNCSDLFV